MKPGTPERAGHLSEVRWIELPSNGDPRGVLTAVESGRDIPFEIRRVFYMHHIEAPRGGHAHCDTDQVLVAISGSFRARIFDGKDTLTEHLPDPSRGLYVPRMLLVSMDEFTPGAVCLVFASTHYDIRRSLRSREEYLRALAQPGKRDATP